MTEVYVETDKRGNRFWHNQDGQLHREDGPAIEWADGMKEWWVNGQLHREDGPAIEYADGTKKWYLDGEELTEEEFNLIMGGKMEKVYIVEADDRYYDSGEQWTSTLAYEDIAEAEVEMMRMKKEYTGDKSNLCIKVVPIYIKKKGIPK
jgi:hypothetical protein